MGFGWLVGAFLFWILCGAAVMVAMPMIRSKIGSYSRRTRAGLGLALLLTSGVILIGGLLLMMAANGRASLDGGVQFMAIALGGALFVATQSLATAFLLSVAHPGVTPSRPNRPSTVLPRETKNE